MEVYPCLRRAHHPAMLYRFGDFELDTAKVELRAGGDLRRLEPQVFALIALLVEHRERLVSRDEIIEKVWEGRVVSDAAVASRIKSARQALGDDGLAQQFIKTIHGQGFRFVANAVAVPDAWQVERAGAEPAALGARPSIAVMPFRLVGDAGPYAAIAEAIPEDLISELARLHWLFVTARGSSFRLGATQPGLADIGSLLGVRYALSGSVQLAGRTLEVMVELADTRDSGVVWAERFSLAVDNVHGLREDIRARVITALDLRIPLHEAGLARALTSEHLDAWSAYHLGLQHMYRFNRKDNAAAAALFGHAVSRDPDFARAHAGLSFTHFQAAFLRHTADVAGEIARARHCAERGLELDPIDPFVNFAMGRSYWLEGDLEGGLGWLERSVEVCPNYAQGIYARAWTEALMGRGVDGRNDVDLAMRLSPLDPMYYAMLGTRALSHLALGEETEAAGWAERAACSPGAHVLIAMIAVAAHALGGEPARAAYWAANVRSRNPALTREEFFCSFPMKPDRMRARVSGALARFGF